MTELPGTGPEDQARKVEEEFQAREFLARQEEYVRDPLSELLLHPHETRDISIGVERAIEAFTDYDQAEAKSSWKIQNSMDVLKGKEFAFGLTHQQLKDLGYIEGDIDTNGYLVGGGKPLRFGFAIRVETETSREDQVVLREERHLGSDGLPTGVSRIKEYRPTTKVVERFYYGTDAKRRSLSEAARAGYERLIDTVRLDSLYNILDSERANLDGIVSTLYLKARHFSNEQIHRIFNAPDISLITAENLTNMELGYRRDRAMRLLDLLGNCETRQKMEDFMNKPTFKKILDKKLVARALELMAESRFEDPNGQNLSDEERVARFLIGKAAVKRDGKWVLESDDGGWLTEEDRDPSKVSDEKEKDKRGAKAVKEEENVRGFLTKYGNPYSRGGEARDAMKLLLERASALVGDRLAVQDADRFFQIFGLKDEMGLETYAELPKIEEIIQAARLIKTDYGKWRTQADEWLRYFSLPGEPIGSDLSKIIHTKHYRLKDILRDRPSGPIATAYDYDRLTQSLFSLARLKRPVVINGEEKLQTRSVLELWRGYPEYKDEDSDINMPREEASDLGEIDWLAVRTPTVLAETAAVEKMKEERNVRDSAYSYYALMNWLAGRDSFKAPWVFINDEVENFGIYKKVKLFASIEKFLSIVWHREALVMGEWRKRYIEAKKKADTAREQTGKQVEEDDIVKEQVEEMEKKALGEGKKNYWKGVRSLPDFPEAMAQKVRIIKATKAGTGTYEVPLLEVVEGSAASPGLAVRYGFLDAKDILKGTTTRVLEDQSLR